MSTQDFTTAIDELKKLKTSIEQETWADELGKRYVLAGIKMAIARLEKSV